MFFFSGNDLQLFQEFLNNFIIIHSWGTDIAEIFLQTLFLVYFHVHEFYQGFFRRSLLRNCIEMHLRIYLKVLSAGISAIFFRMLPELTSVISARIDDLKF